MTLIGLDWARDSWHNVAPPPQLAAQQHNTCSLVRISKEILSCPGSKKQKSAKEKRCLLIGGEWLRAIRSSGRGGVRTLRTITWTIEQYQKLAFLSKSPEAANYIFDLNNDECNWLRLSRSYKRLNISRSEYQ